MADQGGDADIGTAAPSIRGGLSPEASRLFRAYRTISNMLSKRGYMIPKEMREMTPTSFKQRFGEHPSRESLTILVEKADDSTNQLFVFFPEDEKLGVKPIKIFEYLVPEGQKPVGFGKGTFVVDQNVRKKLMGR